VIEAALYNPATLRRIKAGVPASAIGWSQDRYERVCRAHGYEIVGGERRSTSIVPASPDDPPAWAPAPIKIKTEVVVDPGTQPTWDMTTLTFSCGKKTLEIKGRATIAIMNVLFNAFCLNPHTLTSGTLLAERARIAQGSTAVFSRNLNRMMRKTGWHVEGHAGRGGGYRLARVKP
jgi:hypothetical protein